MFILSQCT